MRSSKPSADSAGISCPPLEQNMAAVSSTALAGPGRCREGKTSLIGSAAVRGKQPCMVIPDLANSPGCHIPDGGAWSENLPWKFLPGKECPRAKKCWDILLKLAGDEEQKGTRLYLGLVSSLLPNFEPSGWFSFVPGLPALTLQPFLSRVSCSSWVTSPAGWVPQKPGVGSGAEVFSPHKELLL